MYLGNAPLLANFARDHFDGGAASYTLTYTPGSQDAVLVTVDGVVQKPTTDYTISGTTLTPVTAWPSGTGNVSVLYLGREAAIGTPSDGSVTAAKIEDAAVTFAKLAAGAVGTQAEIEAQTASKLITAALMKYHPGMPKAWARFTSAGTVTAGYNVASVTKGGTGDFTVNFTTAMADTNYAVLACAPSISGGERSFAGPVPANIAVGSFRLHILSDGGVISDPSFVSVVVYGDQ